jgi:hypothetical protein
LAGLAQQLARRPVRAQGPELQVLGLESEPLVQQTDRRQAEPGRVRPVRAGQLVSWEHQQRDQQQAALVPGRVWRVWRVPGRVLSERQQRDQLPAERGWVPARARRAPPALPQMDQQRELEQAARKVWLPGAA